MILFLSFMRKSICYLGRDCSVITLNHANHILVPEIRTTISETIIVGLLGKKYQRKFIMINNKDFFGN